MTPGYRTTEFWISAVVVVVGLLISSGVLPANVESLLGLLAAAVGGGTYTLSRAGLKKSLREP
jgi:hypothetical protein